LRHEFPTDCGCPCIARAMSAGRPGAEDGVVAVWEWCKDLDKEASGEAEWGGYTAEQNAEIEKAYSGRCAMCEVTIGVRTYQLVFDQRFKGRMVQHDPKRHRTRTVRRRLVAVGGGGDGASAGGLGLTTGSREDMCVLCAQTFQETPTLPTVRLQCGHDFHGACTQPLADDRKRCPLCCANVVWEEVVGLTAQRDRRKDELWRNTNGIYASSSDPGKFLLAMAFQGNPAGVRKGLESGISVESRSPLGATPLIMAAMQGHYKVAEMLLKAAANVHVATDANKTALWAAGHQGHKEVARLLLEHRANPHVRSEGILAASLPVVAEFLHGVGVGPAREDLSARKMIHMAGNALSTAKD